MNTWQRFDCKEEGVAVGTDIIEIARIEAVMQRHPESFAKRILTETEMAYCAGKKNAALHYAGRFAAKEAILKALGTGLRGGIRWTDMQITNDMHGKPVVELMGKALEIARRLGTCQLEVSISHCKGYANAVAMLRHKGAKG